MPIDARPTLAEPDDDPYLWLEDVDGPRALQWVDAQTAETLRRFGSERFARDRDVLTALFDRPDRIPGITRRGGAIYNFWQDAANPKGLWRRTTLASYREADPSWEVLLDLDALAKAEGEDWIWAGASTLPPAPRSSHSALVARRRRRGGAARVRHSLEAFRRRRISPARSEGRRLLARSRHAAGFQRSRRGNGDAVRLRPNRPALATRRGFRKGRHPVRDPIREIVRRWLARSHLDREAIGLHGASQLFRT